MVFSFLFFSFLALQTEGAVSEVILRVGRVFVIFKHLENVFFSLTCILSLFFILNDSSLPASFSLGISNSRWGLVFTKVVLAFIRIFSVGLGLLYGL